MLLLLSLTSCKAGDDYERPEIEVNKNWSKAAANDIVINAEVEEKQWWNGFNDKLLNYLIETASANNFDTRIAKARVKEARALANASDAELLPQVNIAAGATKNSKNGVRAGSNTELFEAGFDAVWEADIFGANRRLSESAQAEYELIIAEAEDIQLSLIAEVARNYVELRLYQQQLEIAKNTLKLQTNTARITQARYTEGVEGNLELQRANAQLESTGAEIPLYENYVEEAVLRLELLLGLKTGDLNKKLAEAKPIPVISTKLATATPLAVIARRPDIRMAERRLASATALSGAAMADFYPKISLSATLGSQNQRADDLFSSSSKVWSLGSNLLMPLFDFGRLSASLDARESQQEQAFVAYEKAVRVAIKDVEAALVAYAKEGQRNESLQRSKQANVKLVEIAQAQYKEGIISQFEVIQAEQDLYESESLFALSQAQLSYNLIALYKALALM